VQCEVERDKSQDAVFEVKVAPVVTFPELEVFNKARRRRNDRGRGAGIAGLLAVFLAIKAGGEYGKEVGVGESYSAKSTQNTVSFAHNWGCTSVSSSEDGQRDEGHKGQKHKQMQIAGHFDGRGGG
jgi:hypothetical protein